MLARSDLALHITFAIVGLTYALVRYCVFGTVPWKDVPVFIVNKGVSFYVVLALAAWAWLRMRGQATRASTWRRALLAATLVHVVMSLAIMSPAFFGKIYAPDGRFSLLGGLGILAGILGLAVWWSGPIRRLIDPRSTLRVGSWLLVGHLAAVGFGGWTDPGSWPGAMPPITLWCALLAVAAAIVPQRR